MKTSTSHKDNEPSDPTNCKNTYCPTRVRAQVNDFVEPSSGKLSKKKRSYMNKTLNGAIKTSLLIFQSCTLNGE